MSPPSDDKGCNTAFQKHCNKAINELSEEIINKFNETTNENSRIQLLYENNQNIPITITQSNGKNVEAAAAEKTKGNAYFAKKDYGNAINAYNIGIIYCPQTTGETRELLSILISNRSATYFELKEYKKVLDDIDYLLEIGNYPQHLRYKIWLRKAKCYDAFQNEALASEAYDEAIKSLKCSKLDDKAVEDKTREIEKARKAKVEVVIKNELALLEEPEVFEGSTQYVAAHRKIIFQEDPYQGRHAVAIDTIETGTIIIEENAHCAVVDKNHALTNCQYCFSAVDRLISCPNCANVVFCSTICERLANKSYHKFECPIQSCLHESGVSVNCLLALRIITQKHYTYFNDKKMKLKDYLDDNCTKNIITKKTYRYDDYDNVFFLCRNESMRNKSELIYYTCMAIYLLRLLKYGKYFPFDTADDTCNDDEIYFGSLILRHLQLLQFNAHEVSELKNLTNASKQEAFMTKYENATIGAGLYPTLALFNHSCDPSIVRYNIKNKMVVRTIKPIKAGDIIYENYGPLYMNMQVHERQEILKKNYWFECLCIPCIEMWPMYKEMNENQLRIPCKTDRCPFVYVMQGDGDPFFTCDYCQKLNSILPNLKGLMILDEILPEAEALYGSGQLKAAMNKFISGLELLFKFTKPPHPEIIKVQQRIRNCMVHLGNKSCNYKLEL